MSAFGSRSCSSTRVAYFGEKLPCLGVNGRGQHARLAHVLPIHHLPWLDVLGMIRIVGYGALQRDEAEIEAVVPTTSDGDVRVDQRL